MAFADPFADFDQLSASFAPRKKKPQRAAAAFTPAEQESILGSLGRRAMSGFATVGNVLDTPGSIVRGALAGRNPLPGVFDPERRTSGRDLLEAWGLLGKNREGFDAGDAAGFAADVLLDPTTYLGGIGLVGKAGKVAQAAGLAKGLKRTELLSSTLDDLVKRAGPAGAKAAEDAAQAAGVKLADVGGQKVGATLRIGLPLQDPSHGLSLGGTGMDLARGLDRVGEAARFGNLPGTSYSPGRHAAALFDRAMGGAMTRQGQKLAARVTAERDLARPDIRSLGSDLGAARERAGLTGAGSEDAVRQMAEGVVPAHPELVAPLARAHAALAQTRQAAEDLGMDAPELKDSLVGYWPRGTLIQGGGGKNAARQYNVIDESQLGRQEHLKDIQGGTASIKEIARDPDVEEAALHGPQAVEAVVRTKYGQRFAKPERIGDFSAALSAMEPDVRQAGIFGHDPIADLERHLHHRWDAIHAAGGILDALAEPNAIQRLSAANGGHAGTTSVGELFGKLGLKAGTLPDEIDPRLIQEAQALGVEPPKATGGLIALAQRMGVPPNRDMLQGRIADDLAGDMGRYFEGFKKPEAAGKLLDLYDSLTNATKALLTGPWPAFQTRNLVGGQFQNWTMGAFSPHSLRAAWRLLRGGVVPEAEAIPTVRRMLLEQGLQGPEAATDVLRQLVRNHELVGRYEGEATNVLGATAHPRARTFEDAAAEFPGGLSGSRPFSFRELGRKAAGRAEGTNLNPLDVRGVLGREATKFGPVAAGQDLGYLVEGLNRVSPFIEMLGRGVDPALAAKKIGAAHVNYGNRFYTPVEKEVLSRLFPFYKFSSRQMPFLLRTLFERPGGRLGQSIRLGNAMRGDSAAPDQISDTAAIPIPAGVPFVGPRPGGDPRYLTGFGLMPEDPLQFFGGGLRGAGLEALGRLNPAIKGPLEFFTGQSFFQKGPHGARSLDDLDPLLGRLAANVAGREDAVHYPGEKLLEPLLANSPLSRVLSSARTATDRRKNLATKLVNLGTGLRLTDVPAAKRDALLREQAQEMLRDVPGARDFVDTYLPAERYEKLSPEGRAKADLARAALDVLAKRAKERKKERERSAGTGKL